MKRLTWFLLILVIFAGLYGCAKVVDTSSSGGGGGSTTLGALTGTVTEIDGTTALQNAVVTLTGVTSTAATNASGWFALGNISAGGKTITITKTGFVTVVTTTEIVGGQTRHHNYTMAAANAATTGLAATSTATVSATSTGASALGAILTIPPNSLVTSTGAPYTGTYQTSMTPGDASSSQEIEALFPGRFIAQDATGASAYIFSYGFSNFNVTDGSGGSLNLGSVSDSHKLALAAGATATWKQEIPPGMVAGAPATIAMWYYDETANIWKQGVSASGTPLVGTLTTEAGKSYYVGQITHFSTWNYDVSNPPAFISGRVVNSSGEVISGAEVKCWGQGWVWRTWRSGETGTDSLGRFIDIPVERDKFFFCQAIKGSQRSRVYTFGQYAGNSHTDVGDIVIEGGSTANIQFILTWGEKPSDLDSHLTVPTTTGITTRGHVYFSSKGSPTDYPYAWLDVDDTSSYGPEVVTVTRKLQGTYRYCIHNWSGQSSWPIEQSEATISGIIGGNYYTWSVPTSNPGNKNVWRVCDLTIDGSGNVSVSTLNDFANSSDTDAYNPAGVIGAPTQGMLLEILNAKKK